MQTTPYNYLKDRIRLEALLDNTLKNNSLDPSRGLQQEIIPSTVTKHATELSNLWEDIKKENARAMASLIAPYERCMKLVVDNTPRE